MLTDTLENAETGRLKNKLANNKAKAPLAKACDMVTVPEVETRSQQINNVNSRALVGTLAKTSRRSAGRDTCRHTKRCGDQDSGQNANF